MGGCLSESNSKQAIYKVNIPEFIDPPILPQLLINPITQNPSYCVTKDYFSPDQSEEAMKDLSISQPTDSNTPQKQRILPCARVTEFKQKYSQCIEFYQFHQIDKAHQLACYLLVSITSVEIENHHEVERELLKIQNEYRKVNSFQKQISQTGWEFKGEDKGVRVSSKRETDTVAVLIEAEINLPVEILAAVLTEVDLFYKFVPFMKSSKELKVCARNAKIGHCINDFPLLSKREAFFFGIGYDRLDHNGSIFIYTQSLLQNQELMKEHNYYPQTTKGAVQLDYKYLIFQYIPRDKTSGLVRLAINVDMKLPFVPMFILDPATRDFGYDFFKNMVKISKNFQNSQWKARVRERPDLFNFFRNRVQEYIEGG